ncbi:male-specific lethal 1 homolog [Haliotis cracherodii]|uniref:male-specific lethal 1 homolog n=1 Tax=Haliotis cracherodii TaxID=6455 RepID=UPI0039ECF587
MKSDVNTMDSKFRSEGRHYLQKRRLSSKAMNGGFDEADLNLAIQESLKYAKGQKDPDVKKDSDNNQNTLCGRPPLSTEDHNALTRMTGKLLNADGSHPNENKQLKDLLLLHIELIQHQQDMISKRDKEIKTLKSEKNALQCRLERMERRMSILKQKEESHDTHVAREAAIEAALAIPPDKGVKRKAHQSATEKDGLPSKRAALDKESPRNLGNRSVHRTVTKTVTKSQLEVAESDIDDDDDDDSDKEVVMEGEETLLKTDCTYHVTCCEARSRTIDNISYPNLCRSARSQTLVETPTWRFNKITNLYQLEGTENLEDEVFIKRHQKPELEERRRKRWDLQQLREQRNLLRLKEKEQRIVHNTKEDDESHVESFIPCLDDITHIEVGEKLTVTAFGQPIPHMKPLEFELPWETNRQCTLASRKSTVYRPRRR